MIDPAGSRAAEPLKEVTASGYEWLFVESQAELEEEHPAYGLAVWQPRSGGTYAIVTKEASTRLAVAEVLPQRDSTVGYRVVREIEMPGEFALPDGSTWAPCEEPGVGPQFEGLTVDQATDTLYAAQEDVGLWRIDLTGRRKPVLVDKVKDFGIHDAWNADTEECEPLPGQPSEDANPLGGNLTADAEGVDLFYGSDGLAVTNRPVGRFRQGLLVTHDEPETGPGIGDDDDATNFSYVQWSDIAEALGLPLNKTSVRASNDPRFR